MTLEQSFCHMVAESDDKSKKYCLSVRWPPPYKANLMCCFVIFSFMLLEGRCARLGTAA